MKNLRDIVAILALMGLACISAFVFHTDGKVLFGAGVAILCITRKEVLDFVISNLPRRKQQ